MIQRTQFRSVSPILQTVLAVFFGGRGLWLRNSILSRPFLGTYTGWDTTLRFHVWPWPLKFAVILNMPAFLAGGLLAWPREYLRPGLPEWVTALPVLLVIPLFWYWVGSWADRNINERARWILLPVFILLCAAASSISEYVGGHTSYVLFGIAIWSIVIVGAKAFAGLRKRNSKVA